MRAVVVTRPGEPEVLAVQDVPEPVAGPGQLAVQVVAAGVNRADLLQRAGRYPVPPGAPRWPGLEISGTVTALGPGLGAGPGGRPWAVGDRVAALLPGGGYAERAVTDAALTLPVPDDVDLADAAGLPEALATVLSNLGPAWLAPGRTVLVHGGSGGVGSVAVQLAHALGARVVSTAGGPERVGRVHDLGADVALDHREPDLVGRVHAATDGHGVDAVLDILGAAALDDNIAMLAPDGLLAIIGLQRGRRGELDLNAVMSKRLTLTGTTLRARPAEQKAAIMADVRERGWSLVVSGAVRPVVHARLPFEQAAEAHRLVEAGEAFGKVLLVP